jgi:hypothetical protein
MEPGTPTPVLQHGAATYPLTWTKRSEAVLSRHGYDVAALVSALGSRRRALYAMCLGLFAALRPEHAPEEPEAIAEMLPDEAAQLAASRSLAAVIRHAYPPAAEKKSASNP